MAQSFAVRKHVEIEPKYFELHVTVSPERILEFAEFCKHTGAKPLYIQLDDGLHKNQPMLAVTAMLPDDKTALIWAADYKSTLERHFTVTRTKLESRLTEGPNEYYEAHWKFEFVRDRHFWECTLNSLKQEHPHLLRSHNLLDTHIHYVSQRIYGSSDPLAASTKFSASGELMTSYYKLPFVKTHYERCIFDSNPALDFGWA